LHSVLREHLAVGLQGATYVCGVHDGILPKTHADVKTHYRNPASTIRVTNLHTIGPPLSGPVKSVAMGCGVSAFPLRASSGIKSPRPSFKLMG
jgi:hypothetical protein